MSSLRGKVDALLIEKTLADEILDELLSSEITEENYVEYFDAAQLIEIFENDIRRRRMLVALKMKTCHWIKIKDMKKERNILT